ncbi:hypothetical protein BC939DRAFT_450258 [Gamsiella multidivaricata]|uniref:uncharacterized protein n=1 Tax=Gamsiella multidivaricata TaxID=101098 RepID=UPI00221FAC18|nr:uncharacterized protein BC939DRAFT_450258 [Gamsiella multidivaricata]KAG0365768.1 hypothetical protein BGZ54_006214 [Gamsiella multidivaricata]KAI7824398.1 hypothetical protein BC939DRAFT_450258 [Gamsiella multidivaricata]
MSNNSQKKFSRSESNSRSNSKTDLFEEQYAHYALSEPLPLTGQVFTQEPEESISLYMPDDQAPCYPLFDPAELFYPQMQQMLSHATTQGHHNYQGQGLLDSPMYPASTYNWPYPPVSATNSDDILMLGPDPYEYNSPVQSPHDCSPLTLSYPYNSPQDLFQQSLSPSSSHSIKPCMSPVPPEHVFEDHMNSALSSPCFSPSVFSPSPSPSPYMPTKRGRAGGSDKRTGPKTSPKSKAQAFHACEWPGCTKVFTRKYNYDQHYKTHEGIKTNQCSHKNCMSAFIRISDLQRHMRRHTGATPFGCEHCGSAFKRSEARQRHYEKVHGYSPSQKKTKASSSKHRRVKVENDYC